MGGAGGVGVERGVGRTQEGPAWIRGLHNGLTCNTRTFLSFHTHTHIHTYAHTHTHTRTHTHTHTHARSLEVRCCTRTFLSYKSLQILAAARAPLSSLVLGPCILNPTPDVLSMLGSLPALSTLGAW